MEEKQLEIIDGAVRVFKQFGIRSVSMDDMAKELRVSKKTIYVYYKNKQELVGDVLDRIVYEDDYLGQIENQQLNAIEQFIRVGEMLTEAYSSVNLAMMFDMNKYYPELADKFFSKKTEMVYARIIGNLELGVKEGLYRDDINTELVASLYTERIKEFRQLCGNERLEQFSFKEILVQLIEGHIRGVASPKGFEYLESIKHKLDKIKAND